ncbi:mitochondrial tRNA methylthiotransferase CDK5RAP1 isoform X2 [Narcine bancroftii]|uniref:mitochondrial tRNA methylthiotransferase CDK5RAP1 isoform X2 n=1 Tax=Narcine bancroftii TaxID=1343680 RepID=UPI003831D0A8
MRPACAVSRLLTLNLPRASAPHAVVAGTLIRRYLSLGAELGARPLDGPGLRAFLRPRSRGEVAEEGAGEDAPPYVKREPASGRSVYFETYGCQMNVNDTEIAWSILQKNGYQKASSCTEADVILLVTCSIREKAEQTIWNRLKQLAALKSKRAKSQVPLKIGILGCMAERLKEEILEKEKLVDILAGPDSYRDLPRLLTITATGQKAVNVLLSLDETYADVMPVQVNSQAKTALISIMRGCNNMCSYCIVPFTRGRERSRPISSILQEVKILSDQVLQLIQERANICKQIHLPAQSGSTAMLKAMRRGYTREAYLELVEHVRKIIPGVSLSSDFIAGFCGETEDDHLQTISLLRQVQYNVGYLFAYSLRKKTHAHHKMKDSVPAVVKQRRLEELIAVFREEATKLNTELVGTEQVVLVEGASKRSKVELCGRNDANIKVIIPNLVIPCDWSPDMHASIRPGDYISVQITSASSQSLKGTPIYFTTLNKSAMVTSKQLDTVSDRQ